MYEINKEQFGTFLAQLRKEKGLTQKDLAALVSVSDKAVSKWERGLSFPDITLLIPLAQALEVTVSELLQGQRTDTDVMGQDQVEELVQTAISLSDRGSRKSRRRRASEFGCFAAANAFLVFILWRMGLDGLFRSPIFMVSEILSLVFGGYFWVFAPERLPDYYDQNQISAYSDGIFRMNIPGISFNNQNWPHILRAGRCWAAAALALMPLTCGALRALTQDFSATPIAQGTMTAVYVCSLFLSIIATGKKYGTPPPRSENWKYLLFLPLLLLFLSPFQTTEKAIGWSYSYTPELLHVDYLQYSGQLEHTLYLGEEPVLYALTVPTTDGYFSLTLTDDAGNELYAADGWESVQEELILSGTVHITFKTENHRSGLRLQPKR